MRHAAIVALAIAMASSALAEKRQNQSGNKRHVPVYFGIDTELFTSPLEKAWTEQEVAAIFAQIGIRIDWLPSRKDTLHTPGAIIIDLTGDTPATQLPGAMAYAEPYEGGHIKVFYDRMQTMPDRSTHLAHVMAHEITHILEGINRHSATGLMKAHWNQADRDAMHYRPLPFDPADVDLIDKGLALRGRLATMRAEALAGARSAIVNP
jgi:hypothetical protein